jgi:signal peptidase I
VAHGALASATGLAVATVATLAAVDLAALLDRPAVAEPSSIGLLASFSMPPAMAASTLVALVAATLLLTASWVVGVVDARSIASPRTEAGTATGERRGWIVGVLDTFFAILVGAVVCLAFLPSALGVVGAQAYTLTSGSMGPDWPSGTLVATIRPADPASLAPGDAIVFLDGDGNRITHRIVAHATTPAGLVYQTRGDAAPAPDPALVRPDQVVGRVVAGIPGLGALRAWLFSADGLLAVLLAATILLEAIALAETDIERLRRQRATMSTSSPTA